ncbi:F-box domain containing protein [Coccidioides posadasii C735 delta SOWgp]|uniref:F-box domain containing protein n=1 Tax=Coccidioides posadasii (strain C735) TaxID=222929 RepID=C5P0M1_COCP7|nr:F-box domain containing protein [Coccidioides posadasii C735 delta SOWgp]EER29229.1 F-box domain containing protein [Coccidioides posadasii C735 delta SOWgp]|eukprot:XP_003071374.1 F-box domain containing protein [Coccidioides posadasii C735 delta SOWgp]
MEDKIRVSLLVLPSEIIYNIVSYLPTLASITHLSRTCRRLYEVISADHYRILQAFVKSQFPSIETPPFWADAARALTSRSRAFDRRAVIARFILPPDNATRIGNPRTIRTDHPTLGYRPVIDSYEVWYGNAWSARKEVLVWGAGADLVIRIKDYGRKYLKVTNNAGCPSNASRRRASGTPQDYVSWATFNDLHGVNSWDDISGVHLLGSSHSKWTEDEDIIFGRRNGKLVRTSISAETGSSRLEKSYLTLGGYLEGTDISSGPCRMLAASMNRKSILFFRVDAEEDEVHPFETLKITAHGLGRYRCSRILCDEKIAVGSDGESDKISVFSFRPNGTVKLRDLRVDDDEPRRAKATTIEPLTLSRVSGGNPGDLFLSGWEDSKTRQVPLRSGSVRSRLLTGLPGCMTFAPQVRLYTVDDSPIYSLKPIGRERFVVGSGIHALVKIFDMRMGRYSYLDAALPAARTHIDSMSNHNRPERPGTVLFPSKDISIFLSNRIQNLPGRRLNRLREPHRYRGPIYTISQPSPSSSTFYIGVEDSVIRLDMVSTDDLAGKNKEWYQRNLDLGLDQHGGVDCQPLDLSCYERPFPRDQGRGVRLMMQDPLWMAMDEESRGELSKSEVRIPGWDRRWFQPWVVRNKVTGGTWRRVS